MSRSAVMISYKKMNKEKDIKANLFRVVGDVATLVQVDYIDKNVVEHNGLFIVDSGSTENVLSHEMAEIIAPNNHSEEEPASILTSSGDTIHGEYAQFNFVLGGKQFNERFCITEKEIPEYVKGYHLLGIIGIPFLVKHNLVIDFSDYTLHTSTITPESLSISDCDYFVPMELGFKHYGLPIVFWGKENEEILVLADTGSTHNVIASKTLTSYSLEYQELKSVDTVFGLGGSTETKEAMVHFDLLTLNDGDVGRITRKDLFKVQDEYFYNPDAGKNSSEALPPIEAVLGVPFMAKENWVLDFCMGIIYIHK